MTGSEREDVERLTRFLSRLDRRDRVGPILRGATAGAGLGLLGVVVRAVAGALGLLPAPAGSILLALAWILPLAGALAGYRRPDLRRAAALGDRRGDLADLLKTAHGFESSHRAQETWRPLLEQRAAQRVATINAASVVPIPWRPIAGLTVLLLACALVPQAPSDLLPRPGGLASLATAGAADGEPAEPAATAGAAPGQPEPEPERAAPPRLQLTAEQLARLRAGESPAGDAAASAELGAELDAAERAAEAGAASAQAANQDLLREVRRQLEEEGTLPSAAESGAPGEAGEASEGTEPDEGTAPGEGGPSAPADPELEHETDELTTIDAPTSTPSSQTSRRSAGTAEVAVPAGLEVEAGDQPRQGAESGDPGAAEGGSSTAPQEGFVDPLGELSTTLDVTLQLALLESQRQEAARETSREMTPSRAGESSLRASARQPVAPTAEAVPSRQPVAWRHRKLVRQYFDPTENASQETPPS